MFYDREITSDYDRFSNTINTLQDCLVACLERDHCKQISFNEDEDPLKKNCKLYDTVTPESNFSTVNQSVVIRRLCFTGKF